MDAGNLEKTRLNTASDVVSTAKEIAVGPVDVAIGGVAAVVLLVSALCMSILSGGSGLSDDLAIAVASDSISSCNGTEVDVVAYRYPAVYRSYCMKQI